MSELTSSLKHQNIVDGWFKGNCHSVDLAYGMVLRHYPQRSSTAFTTRKEARNKKLERSTQKSLKNQKISKREWKLVIYDIYIETTTLWPGQAMSLQVKEILHVEKSKYQDVLVFQSVSYGNVLVLDGVIQATERDEFAYQELIAHLPLNSHPNPKKILVIGGGDGGVLREVVKHECVESVTLVEIDEIVPKVSKKFLPAMAAGFQHPKVNLIIGDGFEYLSSNPGAFDVIITDSSDPVGPAEALFSDTFYGLMQKALLPGGIICTQGECQWLHLPLIKKVLDASKKIYPVVSYAWVSIPTYPSGQIGFVLCSKDASTKFETPLRKFSKEVEKAGLKYYNSQVHSAAFVLPQFARNVLDE